MLTDDGVQVCTVQYPRARQVQSGEGSRIQLAPPRPVEYGHVRYHARMGTSKVGEGEAAALDAVAERLAKKVAPKLERLREAEGSARGLRAEVADLNETVEELAEQVAEVKQKVRAARKRRAHATGGGED